MIETYILVIGIIITLIVLYFHNGYKEDSKKEPFVNHYLAACPGGFKMYYDSDGNAICYDDTLDIPKHLLKYQKNNGQCILNGASTNEMPNCVEYILEYYKNKSIEFCSSTFPSYFEDSSNKSKGCTKGDLNELLNAPMTTTQPTCIIYPTMEKNQLSKDSCMNYKELDEFQCFGTTCTKQLQQYGDKTPVLIMVTVTDRNGIPRTTYTKKSIIRYFNKQWPNWKDNINIDRSLFVTEVAKAFYIDKTLNEADVDLR
jgi:hypothetical protein